jgi:hypothetical protein
MLNDTELKQLPALTFSWFNPATEKYESVTRGPFQITVKPNAAAVAQVVTEIPSATARTQILGQDILYLKPLPKKWARLDAPFWYTSTLYRSLLPLPALLAVILGVLLRAVRKLHSDPTALRKRGASKTTLPALKAAESAAKQNDADQFFTEIWRTVSVYFGDKLNLSAGEISEARLLDILKQCDLHPDTLNAFRALLQTCEQSRYGMKPQTPSDEMQQMVATVQTVIKHCERKLK